MIASPAPIPTACPAEVAVLPNGRLLQVRREQPEEGIAQPRRQRATAQRIGVNGSRLGQAGGEVRQDGNSAQMLNPIVPMIQYMAGCFSLQAGDVITTGTWTDAWPLQVGENWHAEFSAPLGSLSARMC